MRFEALEQTLKARLAAPLPGVAAQSRLAPRPRIGWRPGQQPADARHSGVLLLLFPIAGDPTLILTVRNRDLQHHAGQVSLPGGAVEPGESVDEAALREAHEEVGIDPESVRIVGGLSSLHVPISGNVLHPRVGFADERPDLMPDHREVERILEIPLGQLDDPSNLDVETRTYQGRTVEVPFFSLAGEKVWGATAMVLAEFLCVIGRAPDPWGPTRER